MNTAVVDCIAPFPMFWMDRGWEGAFIDEMVPRFERDAGTGYGEGETLEDIDLDFFTKRTANDVIENGNSVSTSEPYVVYFTQRRGGNGIIDDVYTKVCSMAISRVQRMLRCDELKQREKNMDHQLVSSPLTAA